MTILLPTEIEAMDPRANGAGPSDASSMRTSSMRSGGTPYWARIDRSDDALLDFDIEAPEFDIDRARALLAQHPTTYRNHLAIAKFIEGWIARITNDAKSSRFNEGFVEALLEVIDHLRDGDFADEPGDELACNGSWPVRT